MEVDVKAQMGLVTDLPGDELGDSAMRIKNTLPASGRNVKARPGVSLVKHYQPPPGRAIIADGLTGDLAQGVMLTTINTTVSALVYTHTTDGVFAFRPRRIASDYSSVTGFDISTLLIGVIL